MADSGKKTQTLMLDRLSTSSSEPDTTSLIYLMISSAAASVILWLPYREDAAGNRVPTVIFEGQPYPFQAFVVLIMFGFSTSLSALYSYNRLKLAWFLRSASAVFLFSAAAVLLFAVSRSYVF